MAPAVPLIAAAAGLGTSALLGGGVLGVALADITMAEVGASLAGFVVSTAVNAIGSRAFAPHANGPAAPVAPPNPGLMVRSAVETHKIIYGQARVSGPLVYVGTTSNNQYIHLVIALAGHEIDSIGTVYFENVPLTLDANGFANCDPYMQVSIPAFAGYIAPPVATISTAVRTAEVVTATTTTNHGFSSGDQVEITATSDGSMDGKYIIQSVPSPTTFTYNNGGPNSSATGGTATDHTRDDSLGSYVRIKKFTGAPGQAASPDMIAEVPGWTAAHTLSGIAYLYVRMKYDPNIFTSGIPNISAVVRGKKVYDPRNTLTAWSSNVALCIRDYLTSDYGFNCTTAEINDTYVSAAANHCDESVTLTTGGTQSRYTANGVLDTASAPVDNLNALVAAMVGTVTYVQGQFRPYAGVYDSSAGDITTSQLAGPVKVHTRTTRQQLFNAVQGTYIDPSLNWQPTDFSPVTNATYSTQDGGTTIYKDIQLPLTQHQEAAQRIAKVILEQARQQISIELPLNHSAMQYAVWDTFTYTDANLGWNQKVFRIKKMSTPGIGPVVISAQEESSTSYDWNSGMATVKDAAPDTTLPNPQVCLPPGALTITESTYVTRDGAGVKASATLSWVASLDTFLYQYQAEYQLFGAAAWTVIGRTSATTIDILDIVPGTYSFRVTAINTLNAKSQYVTSSRQIAGLLAPPTAPQNLTISTIGGLAILRWDSSPDLDVRIGGYYEFRHSPTTSDDWAHSTSIGNVVSGSTTNTVLPLKPGIYLVKAVDSSGIESTTATSVTTTQATALAYANVTSLTESPTFAGTKSGCFVNGASALTISDVGLFDSIPSFDSVSDLDSYGGIATSGIYTFAAGIDLTTVQQVRLTAHVQAVIVNVLNFIDDRTALIDSWDNFDGTVVASADAVVYVRTTNDNPAGSPTWSVYNRLDSGEFNCRAFSFESILTSQDPAYNIQVSQLSITVDQVS